MVYSAACALYVLSFLFSMMVEKKPLVCLVRWTYKYNFYGKRLHFQPTHRKMSLFSEIIADEATTLSC
jgi:hypothetical protein